MALSDKNEFLELELQECSNQLSCASALINTLLRFQHNTLVVIIMKCMYDYRLSSGMNDEEFEILNSTLTPIVNSDGGQVCMCIQ